MLLWPVAVVPVVATYRSHTPHRGVTISEILGHKIQILVSDASTPPTMMDSRVGCASLVMSRAATKRGNATRLNGYARSTAKCLRSPSVQWTKAPSWVARKITRGAWFASRASCQRAAHRHQRSPGLRPGKPNSGSGVERSLPRDLENSRNAEVITTQTVWLPISSRPVLQQPSR